MSHTQAHTLVIAYERRPGTLVATGVCARVTSVTGLHYTCANVPVWTTATDLDAVQAKPGLDLLAASANATVVTAGTSGGLAFTSAIDSMAVGDFFCPAASSCVVQVPAEVYPMVVQATALRLLESDGDAQGAALAREQLERARMALEMVMNPRHRSGSKKIVNRKSPMRWKGGGYR